MPKPQKKRKEQFLFDACYFVISCDIMFFCSSYLLRQLQHLLTRTLSDGGPAEGKYNSMETAVLFDNNFGVGTFCLNEKANPK